jgi:superfamily II DNA/RNA helicase
LFSLALNPRRFAVQAMVLCPTRELARGSPQPDALNTLVLDEADRMLAQGFSALALFGELEPAAPVGCAYC